MKIKKLTAVLLTALIMGSLTIISAAAPDQPNMTAARNNLNKAEKSLRKATEDKGGHRQRAINLVNQAVAEVNRGIAYDKATPGDRRHKRNSDFADESIFAAAETAADQPNMQAAKDHLQDALNNLQRATADKGGHREKAIDLVRDAIKEVEKGIAYDRNH